MDLRDKCSLCNTTIYEIIQNNQYKVCILCNVYNKCYCCGKSISSLDSYYPYCVTCYNGMLRLSIIIPNHVYISDYYTSLNYSLLDFYGIKQILTIGKELPKHNTPKFKTMYIPLDDAPEEDVAKHFDDAHQFIRQAPTLVHCYAGISRSSSLVLSYLIKHLNMSLEDAVLHCKKIRPIIQPNCGFFQQLKNYETSLKNSFKAL